ncbi:hypothetical protein, partial [Methanocalculus sp.]|uniref:hypothetical protein n=1 Tax=Methanocalculus sp. TaxID=2004547 RepID=UPI0027198AAF
EDMVASDAIQQERLKQLKDRFFIYILKNNEAINRSLPVFFGHVESAIDRAFPRLSDPEYNLFFDEIACQIFRTSAHIDEPLFNERLGVALSRMKRGGGRGALDLVSGLHRIRRENYPNAVEHLKKYQHHDPLVGFALVFCYMMIDLRRPRIESPGEPDSRPSEMALNAREQLMELSFHRPKLIIHPVLNAEEQAVLDGIFWKVYERAREWFPHERWFITIALTKAEHERDTGRHNSVLKEAMEYFPEDIIFMRRSFSDALSKGSIESAALILQTMIKVLPDDAEPIYYGLKLALITGKNQIFYRFRKLAIIRGLPPYLLLLLDYAFEVLQMNIEGASQKRELFITQYPRLGYIIESLQYLEEDAFSGVSSRQKKSQKALLSIIDRFAMMVLKVGEE